MKQTYQKQYFSWEAHFSHINRNFMYYGVSEGFSKKKKKKSQRPIFKRVNQEHGIVVKISWVWSIKQIVRMCVCVWKKCFCLLINKTY